MLKNKTIIFILILAALILSYKIDKPFIGHHDWNSVVYSQVARNYLKFGLWQTKFGQVGNGGIILPSEFSYITHYPPLLSLFIAFSFFLFGVGEWQTRIIPIFANLGMVYFFFLLVKNLWDKKIAALAAVFIIFSPIFIYFGKLTVHETVIPFFSLFSLYFYYRWTKNYSQKNYFFLVLGIIAGELIGWPAYYLPPLLCFHRFFFYKKHKENKKIYLLIPLSFLTFFLFLVHLFLLTGKLPIQDLWQIFLFRFHSGQGAQIWQFNFKDYLLQEARMMVIYFTRITAIFSLIFLLLLFNCFRKKKLTSRDSYLLILLVYGFLHIFIFRNLAFIHDYMIYYALPFMALSASLGLWWFLDRIARRKINKIFFTVFIFLLFATERIPFTFALLNTNMNKIGYDLGKILQQKTQPEDKIFVASGEFGYYFEVFTRFYSDRNIDYNDAINLKNLKEYQLLVIPKTHNYIDEEIKNELMQKYHSYEEDKFIFYEIQ